MTQKRKQLRILIVDDSRTVRMQTRLFVQKQNLLIEEAKDGVEALKKIAEFRPHIVLLDVVMPNMDGIECCRRIKADPQLAHTKVIMVTANEEYESIRAAFQAGSDDYATKPIKKDELMKKIDDLSTMALVNEFLSGLSPATSSAFQPI